jgi:hypothetical protein
MPAGSLQDAEASFAQRPFIVTVDDKHRTISAAEVRLRFG